MTVIEVQSSRCPYCNYDKLVYDQERGRVVCPNCGSVIEDRVLDLEPEWILKRVEKSISVVRAQPTKFNILGSKVGGSSTQRLTQRQISIFNSCVENVAKNQIQYVTSIIEQKFGVKVPENVKEFAFRVLTYILKRERESKHNVKDMFSLTLAIVVYSCKLHGIPITLTQVKYGLGIDITKIGKGLKKIFQHFGKLVVSSEKHDKSLIKYIFEKMVKSRCSSEVYMKMYKLVNMLYDNLTNVDKSFRGRVGVTALTYLVCRIFGVDVTQKEFMNVIHVTDVSIRNKLKELFEKYDIVIEFE